MKHSLMIALMVLCIAPMAWAAPADSADSAALDKIVSDHAKAYITIKYVLQVSTPNGGDQSVEQEIPGVLISDKGLVLCSNSLMGGLVARQASIQANPTDIKVLIGDDTEGLPAKILTRDSELDLAWIKLDEEPKEALAYLDFAAAATPTLGQPLVAVRKLDKFYGRVVVIDKGYLAGETQKPRHLLVASSNLLPSLQALCMPLYTEGGQVVGVTVLQLPESRQPGFNTSDTQGLVLPAEDVVKATQRALEAVKNEGDLKE